MQGLADTSYSDSGYERRDLHPHLSERHDSYGNYYQELNDLYNQGADRLVKCLSSQLAVNDIADPAGNKQAYAHNDNCGEDLHTVFHEIQDYLLGNFR